MVNRYWLPDLVLGKGPTQSTIILLKGSLNAGIGCRGGFGNFLIRLTHHLTLMTDPTVLRHIFLKTGPIEMSQNFVIGLINA